MSADFTPLTGMRVLEISTRVSGAYAGRLLVDLGAQVSRLDMDIAAYAQPRVRDALFAALHRGKRTVDLSMAQELVGRADILLVDVDHDHAFADGAARLV